MPTLATQLLTSRHFGNRHYNKCLLLLRNLCGRVGMLPMSYLISEGLVIPDDHPYASGGFADVWFAQLYDHGVAVKFLRFSQADDLSIIIKASVAMSDSLLWYTNECITGLLQRGCVLETTISS
jgi:hypothetical protein